MKLTKRDMADWRYAKVAFRETHMRAIHVSRDHLRNMPRIARKLRSLK